MPDLPARIAPRRGDGVVFKVIGHSVPAFADRLSRNSPAFGPVVGIDSESLQILRHRAIPRGNFHFARRLIHLADPRQFEAAEINQHAADDLKQLFDACRPDDMLVTSLAPVEPVHAFQLALLGLARGDVAHRACNLHGFAGFVGDEHDVERAGHLLSRPVSQDHLMVMHAAFFCQARTQRLPLFGIDVKIRQRLPRHLFARKAGELRDGRRDFKDRSIGRNLRIDIPDAFEDRAIPGLALAQRLLRPLAMRDHVEDCNEILLLRAINRNRG